MVLSLSSGHSVAYLLGPVQGGREGYYTGAVAAGEPPGAWYGAGAARLGLTGEVTEHAMEAVYCHRIDPRDPASQNRSTWGEASQLGEAPRKYRDADELYAAKLAAEPLAGPERRAELRRAAERAARQDVAFVDATFSAPKSVTVVAVAFERAENDAKRAAERAEEAARNAEGQAGPGRDPAALRERAARYRAEAAEWAKQRTAVERAVMAGARAAVEYLEERAGYARIGHHGGGAGRWIDAHEFTVAQFLQHDSRDRDPQLHVHQAVLTRVECADGKWRKLDTALLWSHRAGAAAHGERVMEAHLAMELGLRLETRPDGKAREVVGVPRAVMELFSKRRRSVTVEIDRLVAAYQARHGREPSPLERAHIAQQATLATRAAKSHRGESEAVRLDRWEREARTALVGGLAKVARNVVAAGRARTGPAAWSPRDVVARALARAGQSRSTWSRSDLTFAVSEALPGPLGARPEQIGPLLESLTDAAIAEAVQTVDREPTEHLTKEFLLHNGDAAYQRPGSQRWANPDQVAAEHTLSAAAVARGAAALTEAEAAVVVARFAEHGRELGADQAAAVRGVLSSGARIEVMAAAAGAGKSFVVGAIADAWAEHGHRLLGLAPSQVAAEVLQDEGVSALNLARWRGAQKRLDEGCGQDGDEELRLRAGDLLVVDEAGMAGTADLADVVARADAAGAKVLLVGDPRQLRAVGPGGALADVGGRAITYNLTEVRRFRRPWEGEASLRLRDEDPTALDQYDRHGHIEDGGTLEQAEQRAARAWLADILAGRDSLLMVGTNEQAARVAAHLRSDLIALGRVSEYGLTLRDGTMAGVGDVVQARRNGWDIAQMPGNTRAPINRETYTVTATWADGSLTVRDQGGVEIRLPASYVQGDLTLAYATTVHGAQGRTVDTGHAVVEPGSPAASVYVQLTRGRAANTAWVVTRATASDAPVGEAAEVEPRVARAVVAEVLERAVQERGAVAEREHEQQRQAGAQVNVDRLADGIAFATAGRFAAILDALVHDGALTETDRAGLAADHKAIGAVERLVRQAEVAGHDPAAVLGAALDGRPLTGARAPAQVLHARLRTQLADAGGLHPTITSYGDLIPAGLSEGMKRQLETYADAADDRRRELGAQTAVAAPAWAVDTLGPVPDDPLARADWETRAGWAAAHRENLDLADTTHPLGPAPVAGLAEKRAVWWTAHHALGLPDVTPAEDAMSDGQLRARVVAYQREETWAPRWVADELAATAQAAEQHRRDAEVWAARAAATGDEDLAAEAERARAEATRLEALRDDLLEVDRARARWYAHTAVTRDRAERSRAALLGRGVDVDDPGDQVTADEWIAAHASEQEASERVRPITDGDVLDELPADADELPPADLDHAAETGLPDLRATSVRDESEDTDPERRVPATTTAAEALQRSRAALVEIALRHAEDAARDAAYQEEEVAWWAADEDALDTDVAEWVMQR